MNGSNQLCTKFNIMSREEEITQQAKKHAKYDVDGDRSEISFQLGAVWADKTLLEKACEWLENNMFDYFDGGNEFAVCDCFLTKENFIEQFKNAMEE